MSIVSDIRTRAEGAVDQGKSVIETAQTRLNGAAEDAQSSAKKFVSSARTQAEGSLSTASSRAKALADEVPYVDLDKLTAQVGTYRKTAVESVEEYRKTVTGKVEGFYNEVRHDKRVEKYADKVEALINDVVETVNGKLVEPVKGRLGLAEKSKPVTEVKTAAKAPARKAAPRKTTASTPKA